VGTGVAAVGAASVASLLFPEFIPAILGGALAEEGGAYAPLAIEDALPELNPHAALEPEIPDWDPAVEDYDGYENRTLLNHWRSRPSQTWRGASNMGRNPNLPRRVVLGPRGQSTMIGGQDMWLPD
jgi:hypothetical protein